MLSAWANRGRNAPRVGSFANSVPVKEKGIATRSIEIRHSPEVITDTGMFQAFARNVWLKQRSVIIVIIL